MKRILAWVVALSACTSEVLLTAPPPIEGTRSELLMLEPSPPGVPQFFMLADDGFEVAVPEEGTTVRWIALGDSKEELGASAGPLVLLDQPGLWFGRGPPKLLGTYAKGIDEATWHLSPDFAPPFDRLFQRGCDAADPIGPEPPRCPSWMPDDCQLPEWPACGANQQRFGMNPDCDPFPLPCPADTYALGLPAGSVYVLEAAAPGGDGSRALPFATLDAALATAAPTIALGAGSYAATRALDSVSLIGLCVAATTITSSIVITGNSALKTLFLEGQLDARGGELLLEETRVRAPITTASTSLTLLRSEVTDGFVLDCGGGAIHADHLNAFVELRATHCPIDLVHSAVSGTFDVRGGSLGLEDVLVYGPLLLDGPGVFTQVLFDSVEGNGIESHGPGFTATDVAIRNPDIAIKAEPGEVELMRTWIRAAEAISINDARLRATDLTGIGIADSTAVSIELFGIRQAHAELTRASFIGLGLAGISIFDGTLSAEDLDLRSFSYAIITGNGPLGEVSPGETVALDRFWISGNGTGVKLGRNATLDARSGHFTANGNWLEACNQEVVLENIDVEPCEGFACSD